MSPLIPTLFAAAVVQAAPAGLADFSGVWTLDPARSETLQAGGDIDRSPVTITHGAASFRIVPSAAGRPAAAYRILDAAARAGAPAAAGGSAYWDGAALVTETQGLVNGKSVTVKQSRTLAPGGAEMLVDTTVAIQHGYAPGEELPQSKARDVYVRVRR